MDSSASKVTLQGRAIKQAAVDFGDGKTLPFCPCKRGYVPILKIPSETGGEPAAATKYMVACSFHEKARRKRLAREKGKLRRGEADPKALFWTKVIGKKERELVIKTTATGNSPEIIVTNGATIEEEREKASNISTKT